MPDIYGDPTPEELYMLRLQKQHEDKLQRLEMQKRQALDANRTDNQIQFDPEGTNLSQGFGADLSQKSENDAVDAAKNKLYERQRFERLKKIMSGQ